MNVSPYERLANAIVLQAVADYCNARKDLKIYPRDKKAMYRDREAQGQDSNLESCPFLLLYR